MHVLENNNMWKLTYIHLAQILLQRRTCCPAVGKTVSRQSSSVSPHRVSLSCRKPPANHKARPTSNNWVTKGLTRPVQCWKSNTIFKDNTLKASICLRAPHQLGSGLQSQHHSLALFLLSFHFLPSHTTNFIPEYESSESSLWYHRKQWEKWKHSKLIKVIEENNKNLTRNYWRKQTFNTNDQVSLKD